MQLEASAKKEKVVDVTVEGWCVEPSDDEWLPFTPADDADPDQLFIPKNVALLFSKVAEKKVLPLSCHCPRRGPVLKDNELAVNVQKTVKDIETSGKECHEQQQPMDVDSSNQEVPAPEGKKAAAFDFGGDDEDDEKPSAKRKTPASGKKKKEKVTSSMTNVMNDLLRHKLLDDLEATKNEEEGVVSNGKQKKEDSGVKDK